MTNGHVAIQALWNFIKMEVGKAAAAKWTAIVMRQQETLKVARSHAHVVFFARVVKLRKALVRQLNKHKKIQSKNEMKLKQGK